MYVYGPKIYHHFIVLARGLSSTIYQSVNDKQSEEHEHTLFLLFMIILLFSNGSQIGSVENDRLKLNKIQQFYIDIAFRFLHDQVGAMSAQRVFQKLAPLFMSKCQYLEEENNLLLILQFISDVFFSKRIVFEMKISLLFNVIYF